MGILSDLTLEQLRNATLVQIRTAITSKLATLTKKQLIILILKVADINIETFEIQDREEGESGLNGQIWRIKTVRDALGNFIRRERFDWTYHPGVEGKRPVHLIIRTPLDVDKKAIGEPEVIVEHSSDGGLKK